MCFTHILPFWSDDSIGMRNKLIYRDRQLGHRKACFIDRTVWSYGVVLFAGSTANWLDPEDSNAALRRQQNTKMRAAASSLKRSTCTLSAIIFSRPVVVLLSSDKFGESGFESDGCPAVGARYPTRLLKMTVQKHS